MTWETISPIFQFLAWLIEKLFPSKGIEPDEKTIKFLKSKGFTWKEET